MRIHYSEKHRFKESARSTKGLVPGTRGCQYDYGLVISGKHGGRVFDTDNEGTFVLLADSFEEFYGGWLDKISDTAWLKRQIEFWTRS